MILFQSSGFHLIESFREFDQYVDADANLNHRVDGFESGDGS
jgi:hypothetical protein